MNPVSGYSTKAAKTQSSVLDLDPSISDQKALSMPSFTVTQVLVDVLAERGGGKRENLLAQKIPQLANRRIAYLLTVPILSGQSRFLTYKTSKNRDVPIF